MKNFYTKLLVGFLLVLGAVGAEAQVTLTATAGTAAGSFTTLKLAFDAINAGTHQGVIVISINASTTEGTTPATLNSSGAGSAIYTSILIQPTVDGVSISGNPVTGFGVIQLKGADNVTIDGDNPNTAGTNRNLTINNTTTATVIANSVIRIATVAVAAALSADNITIKNCNLNGNVTGGNLSTITSTTGSSNSSFGIYCGGNGGATAIDAPTAITSVTTQTAPSGTTINTLLIDNNAVNQCARAIVFNGAASTVSTGVTISNNTIGTAGANAGTPPFTTPSTTVYTKGIWLNGLNAASVTGNTLQNILSYVGTTMTAIETVGGIGSGVLTVTGNNITTVVNNAASTANGIQFASASGTYNISANIITSIQSVGSSCSAITLGTSATSGTVANNKITTVRSRSTGGVRAGGIVITSGNAVTIQNNFIAEVLNIGNGSFGTSFNANGILLAGGSSHKVYHNSVNLFGVSTSAGSNSINCLAITASTQTGIDVRNNIFSNTVTGGAATDAHTCVFLPFVASASMLLNLNNNAYYTGSVAASGLGFGGASAFAAANLYTVANFIPSSTTPATNWRSFSTLLGVAASDNASLGFTTAAPFVSSTDLHISTGVTPTQLESGGATVGVLTDIDNQVRPGPAGSVNGGATAPDLGADEFDGVPLDLTPPTITYTPFTFTCLTTARTLTTTITDASGVPTSGLGLPVLYWKINAGAYTAVTATWGGGSTYTFTFGAGVIAGDVVSYYIVAQDNAPTPNVGSSPSGASGFTINPPAASTPPPTPSSYAISNSIGGATYTVGATGTYTTLTAAINAYNTSCLTGPVVFSLIDAAYTTTSDTIRVNPDASAVNTLTIKPTLAGTTITGNTAATAAATLVLMGADYVTINGSISATANTVCPVSAASRDLTISNSGTSTSSAVIWFATSVADGATNNKVINCNLVGNSNITTLFGVGSGSATIGIASLGTGNNNNNFINNNISKTQYGIFSQGASAANKNTGTIINQNLINTATPNNVQIGGIYVGFDNGAVISRNTVSGMVSGTDAFGISTGVTSWVATTTTGNEVSNVTISKNTIGLVQNTGANSAAGILAGPSATGTNQVSNNMIYGVISNSTPGDITAGIFTICGVGATQVYYNTVSMTGDRGAGTTGSSLALAVMGTDPVIDIRNNILINKQTTASTGKSYAIGLGYSTFVNLTSNYNDLFTSGANGNFGVTAALNSGTDRTTLALWQAATGKDANSKNLDATFMSATDLHLNVSGNPGLNAAATPIAVTDDIDCDPRDGTAPDIGADEFTGVLITDAGVTAIVLPATFCPGSNLVSATVKNFGSTTITSILIDWSVTPGGAQPQVNPGAISIAPGASQTFPLGNFTFAAATTYSITASTSMPNGGADGVPGNDAFTQNNITTGLVGTYTVGVGMNYATLTAAVADYNTKSLCGAVVFNLTDATYPSETFPITINANAASSAVNTLTIKPASGNSPVISGTNATAIIDINNGDYVIIDGSNNGTTSKNLTISNTNTSGSVVRFINDATNNTVKNSILNGVSTSTSNGIVFFSTTTGTTGNDNNIIQNNDIASGASANAYGIYNLGTTTTTVLKNSGLQLIGNNIFNFSNTGIFDAGGSVGTLYRSNQIYEVNTLTTSLVGFRPSNTTIEGFTFTRNRIYDLKTTGTGTVYGVHLFDIQGSAALIGEISNNMIALDAVTPLTMRGIYDQSATGEFFNIYYNSILLSGTVAGVSNSEAYYWSIASTSNVKNNIFTNTRNGGTGKHYSIRYNATLANVTSDYNDIYPGGGTGNVFGNDGTADRANLAAWQTATVKDPNSISVLPNFTSATDLHLLAGTNCGIDGYGTPIAGITVDYDNQARDATTPDMGADEFTATYSGTLAGVAGSATCENKTVSAAGTTFATGTCTLIGRLLPSGASPVSGKVNLCVTLDATQQYFNGGPYVQRHMDIEPASNAATATGTVTLYFTDAEFVNYNTNNPTYPPLPTSAGGGSADPNRANLKITQYHGTPTSTPSAAGLYTGSAVLIIPNVANITYNGSYWSVTFDVNGFSGFYAFTKSGAGPLPISINYFTGNKQGGNHLLNWKVTCNATPKATMTLERSADSRNFTGINTIVADAARCNQPFNYTDAQPLNGMNYYRLKMTDVDGNISYSGIVALLNAVKGFDIVSIAPNPVVTDNFTLNVSSAQASKMELVIIDMQGRLVKRQTISLIAGFNSLPVNVGKLAAGTYTVQCSMGDEKSRIIRFVKQ